MAEIRERAATDLKMVFPKKNLGQHFLKDRAVARKIAGTLSGSGYSSVLEIGPGEGILTEFLLKRDFDDFRVIEIDNESAYFIKTRFSGIKEIIRGDFLKMNIDQNFQDNLAIIGNFPYNISTQILFKILDSRNKVIEVCGMFQKEVAERICSEPGSRTYGIMSVMIQAYYKTEYLFTVPGHVFKPPPRVKSGVIRLTRNSVRHLACDEVLFQKVVKVCFNQRRKMLRNSVKAVFRLKNEDYPDLSLRPEMLSVTDFVKLTNWIAENSILSE